VSTHFFVQDEEQEIVKVDRLISFQASASIAHLVKVHCYCCIIYVKLYLIRI